MTDATQAVPEAPAYSQARISGLQTTVSFLRAPFAAMTAFQTKADLIHTRFFGVNAVFVTRPELVEEVLVRGREHFVKAEMSQRTAAVFGDGLLLAEGETWRRQRKMLNPGFQHARYAGYAQVMVERARALLSGWRDGQTVDVAAEMAHLTLDIAVRTLFGGEVTAEDARAVSTAFGEISNYLASPISTVRMTLPRWLPPVRRYQHAIATLDGTVARLVTARRAAGGGGDDLLGMLLSARDDEGKGLDDREVRDQLVTFLLAGHETTALGLAYALFLLGQDPARRQRLEAEASAAPEDTVDPAAFPFAAQVFKESLRLYPPAYALSREPAQDVTVGGVRIPKGTFMVMAPWMLQRDPRWFDRPGEFIPERWTPELERDLPAGAYFPFGLGMRKCIGLRFANLEGVLLLATVARAVSLAPLKSALPRLQPSVTMRPTAPVPARVQRR